MATSAALSQILSARALLSLCEQHVINMCVYHHSSNHTTNTETDIPQYHCACYEEGPDDVCLTE